MKKRLTAFLVLSLALFSACGGYFRYLAHRKLEAAKDAELAKKNEAAKAAEQSATAAPEPPADEPPAENAEPPAEPTAVENDGGKEEK